MFGVEGRRWGFSVLGMVGIIEESIKLQVMSVWGEDSFHRSSARNFRRPGHNESNSL